MTGESIRGQQIATTAVVPPPATDPPPPPPAASGRRSNVDALRATVDLLDAAYQQAHHDLAAAVGSANPLATRDISGRYILLDALAALVAGRAALEQPEPPMPATVPAAESAGTVRSWQELQTTGLLWLINAAVLHPRGYALCLISNDNGQIIGWQLLGDGSEPWRFADGPHGLDAAFAAAGATLAAVRKPA